MTAQPIRTDGTEIDAGSVTGTETNRHKLLLILDTNMSGLNAASKTDALEHMLRGQGFDIVKMTASDATTMLNRAYLQSIGAEAVLVKRDMIIDADNPQFIGNDPIKNNLQALGQFPSAMIGEPGYYRLGSNTYPLYGVVSTGVTLAAVGYLTNRVNGMVHESACIAAQAIASGCAR